MVERSALVRMDAGSTPATASLIDDMILYRHEDGTFTVSSPSGECSRRITHQEGVTLIERWVPDGEIRDKILQEQEPGFVIC